MKLEIYQLHDSGEVAKSTRHGVDRFLCFPTRWQVFRALFTGRIKFQEAYRAQLTKLENSNFADGGEIKAGTPYLVGESCEGYAWPICTRQPPHVCCENGPCNGWPKSDERRKQAECGPRNRRASGRFSDLLRIAENTSTRPHTTDENLTTHRCVE